MLKHYLIKTKLQDFILTEWYVNLSILVLDVSLYNCFILTMWKKINKKRKHLLLVGAFVLLKFGRLGKIIRKN